MLLIALLLILVGGCGLVVGHSLLTWLDPSSCFDRSGDRAIVSTWIGVLILANLHLAISLVAPLSPPVAIPAALALLGVSLLPRQGRCALGALLGRPGLGTLAGILALTLGVAAYCSQVIVWFDSGLYHVQIIKWLSEYGLVPGLALIHSRLGFVSAWFALPAPFNHGLLQGRVAALPGALCLLLLLIQVLAAFVRIAGRRTRTEDLFIVAAALLVLPVILAWGMPNSPTPDFPVIALGLVVAWTMLALSGRKEGHSLADHARRTTLIPLLLAVGAASIKLSALPLVAVGGCFFLFNGRPGLKKILVVGCLLTLGLAPLAAAGLVTTGCVFYPSSFLCIDAPWSLGTDIARQEFVINRNWNRWGSLAPEYATAWNWILPWCKTERLTAAYLLLSLLAAVSLIASRTRGILREFGYIVALGIFGIVFMLYAAPSWRFGLGYLAMLPALAVAGRVKSGEAQGGQCSSTGLPGNFCLVGTAVAIIVALHVHAVPRPSYRLLDQALASKLVASDDHPHFNLVLSPKLWRLSYEMDAATGAPLAFENVIVPDQTGDVDYYRPENPERFDQCWDAPLPCAKKRLENIRLRQSDSGIAGGFEKIGSGPNPHELQK